MNDAVVVGKTPRVPSLAWESVRRFGMISRGVPRAIPPAIDPCGFQGISMTSICYQSDCVLHPDVFEVCGLFHGGVVAAGGAVLAAAERANTYTYHNDALGASATNMFSASDLDLYIRAATPGEARGILTRLVEYIKPVGVVVRTQYALSMHCSASRCLGIRGMDLVRSTPNGMIIKVQVIDRVIPRTGDVIKDISYLFETYDLDCCKWACDGERFYSTERALDAYNERICYVPWSKIADSSIPRMARYFCRCYDFEIEGVDSRRQVFPQALQKMAEVVASCQGKFRWVADLPGSNYAPAACYDFGGASAGNPMFRMLKSYGQTGVMPHMICGTASDIGHIVSAGTQPETYMDDWTLEMLNKMAETVLWLVSPRHENDRDTAREFCTATVAEWRQLMRECVSFGPMFETPIKFLGLSDEVFQKYWQPVAVGLSCLVDCGDAGVKYLVDCDDTEMKQ